MKRPYINMGHAGFAVIALIPDGFGRRMKKGGVQATAFILQSGMKMKEIKPSPIGLTDYIKLHPAAIELNPVTFIFVLG